MTANVVRIGKSQYTRELKIGSRVRLGGLRGIELHEVIAIEDTVYVARLVERRRNRSKGQAQA